MKQKEISEFYDQYTVRQLKSGANERLIGLYKRLLKAGLRSDSSVVELGCGVGIFTRLLLKTVKTGEISAVDLSPASVQVGEKLLNSQLVKFQAADVVTFVPESRDPDFITLMDVIEHIPLSEHQQLFKTISSYCGSNTLLCINIPNPEHLQSLIDSGADDLQIIDQPVHISPLLDHLENAGLELLHFEKYSIWENEDYHFITARKKREFVVRSVVKERSFKKRLLIKWEKLLYDRF